MTKNLLLALVITGLITSPVLALPPVAPIGTVVDEYYGTKVNDPYRALENQESDEVQRWMRGQANWARRTLDAIPGRNRMLERIIELENSSAASVYNVQRVLSDRYFYYRRDPGDDAYRLCVRDGLEGEEKILVDPAAWKARTGKPHAINYYQASPDGRSVAYGISAGGTEAAVMYVIDVETGEQVSGPIDRTQYGYPVWLPGRDAFTYIRLQKLGDDADPLDKYKNAQAHLHRIGRSADEDQVIFGHTVTKGLEIPNIAFPLVFVSPASEHAFAMVIMGVQREIELYTKPLALLEKPETPWERIAGLDDEVSDFTVFGDELYLLSHKDAPKYKILKTRVTEPDIENAELVLPESSAVIEGLIAARDALYVRLLDGGPSKILRVAYKTHRVEELPMPDSGRVRMGFSGTNSYAQDPRQSGVMFQLTSWTKERRIYSYDPNLGEVVDTGLRPAGPHDAPTNLIAVEVKIQSHDGAKVPLSIVHRNDLVKNGNNPTLMTGYGAYGISQEPAFSLERLAWLEHGGIYAVCHVRGGGEYGVEWHHAGQKLTKPNTWKDFIACGEWLIENGYTSRAKLAGHGRSAGGILIGRSITERPDLFAAAIIEVGMLDAIRSELTPNGPPNIPEFGTHTDENGFRGLREMSAYHHIKDGVVYPAVILLQGINDPRVVSWQSSKMAARLQAATSSSKPVLLRIDNESGHGIGSTKTQVFEEKADAYSFLLWQFGVDGFQPDP